jgi:hypothetical protein
MHKQPKNKCSTHSQIENQSFIQLFFSELIINMIVELKRTNSAHPPNRPFNPKLFESGWV